MSERIIDAEFTDIDGTIKGGPRVLEQVAKVADRVAEPLGQIPGAERAAVRVRQVATVAREADGIIEDAKPLARRVEEAIAKAQRAVGLDDFSERGIMSRR